MASDKGIAARIFAYWNSWDQQAFAEHAEKGLIYRQLFKSSPDDKICGFVIGKAGKEFPIEQLADVGNTPVLEIVLSSDAINLRILSVISSIEAGRRSTEKIAGKKGNSGEIRYSLNLVGDVGKTANGEVRYGYIEFRSSEELAQKIRSAVAGILVEQQKKTTANGVVRLTDSQFSEAIRSIFQTTAKYVTFKVVGDKVIIIREKD